MYITFKYTGHASADINRELSLEVTQEYKAVKAAETIDLESLQNKYGNILEWYQKHYPSLEVMAIGQEYPRRKNEIIEVM